MIIKRNNSGRPRSEEEVPESSEMLDDIKLLYEASIYTLTETMRKEKQLDSSEHKQLAEIAKVIMLMIKDERAARKEDNIESMDDDQLNELAEKATKQFSAKKRQKHKEINEPDTNNDSKS
jgi:hypothetical protein